MMRTIYGSIWKKMSCYLVNFELLGVLGAIFKHYQVTNQQKDKNLPVTKCSNKNASKTPQNDEKNVWK